MKHMTNDRGACLVCLMTAYQIVASRRENDCPGPPKPLTGVKHNLINGVCTGCGKLHGEILGKPNVCPGRPIFDNAMTAMQSSKPRTYFLDIDGTLIEHPGQFSAVMDKMIIGSKATGLQPLPGVLAFLDRRAKAGDYVVLTTGRPERYRRETEQQLENLHIRYYQQLVMGLPPGERIVINDAKADGEVTARAICVRRNGDDLTQAD